MPRSRRGFNQGRRRQTGWELGPGSDTVTTMTSETTSIIGAGIAPTIDGLTAVRTYGLLELILKTSNTIGGGVQGAAGIGLCTDDAFAVGVTAVPNPVASADWEGWLWHQFVGVHTMTVTIADGVHAMSAYQRIQVDSKAMRRLETGMTMFMALEISEVIGTVAMDVHFDSRVLFKLS